MPFKLDRSLLNKSNIRFYFILLLLLTVPLTVWGVYEIRTFFSKAQSFTYKVTRNHQWTCEEQPTWGNKVHILVKDENGSPLAGAEIDFWNDFGSGNSIPGNHQGTLVTGGDGKAVWYNFCPGCLGKSGACLGTVQCPNGDTRVNFFFKIKNAPSDTAVEVTTGYFGNECGELFCPGFDSINVWGHWSYSIDFVRKSGTLSEEEIDTDHAGQSRRITQKDNGLCQFWHRYTPYVSYNPRRNGSNPTATSIPQPTSTPLSRPTGTPLPVYPTATSPPSYPTASPVFYPSPTGYLSSTPIPSPTEKANNPSPTSKPSSVPQASLTLQPSLEQITNSPLQPTAPPIGQVFPTASPVFTPAPTPKQTILVVVVNSVVQTLVNLPQKTIEAAGTTREIVVDVAQKQYIWWGNFFNTILP